MDKAIVYLVGAGPGDPKLITLKGLECIKKANVLIYDRLVNSHLLSYAKPDAELIFVGKSPDNHTMTQDEINGVLVKKAKEGKIVTRLKGGDPFVFGRGGEEAEILYENNIPFEIVPGITSAIAVPAYAGIPVTHRNLTSSVTVITGHEDPAKELSNIDFENLASGKDTLVFLMGMNKLSLIVDELMKYGRPVSTPVAIINWGTRTNQITVVGELNNIVEKANEAQLKPPVVIIVGEVVKLRDKLKWFENKPLFGKRVLVTRAQEQASVLSDKIIELGGEPVEFPTIKIVSLEDYAKIDVAIDKINEYNWIVFTSVNGVKYLFNRLKVLNKDIRNLNGIKLCAIGPRTKEELESLGFVIDYTPDEYRAEAIVKSFRDQNIIGQKFLLPRADIARDTLTRALEDMGAIVDDIEMYKTIMSDANTEYLKKLLEDKVIDIVAFTSSSTVKNTFEMLNSKEHIDLLNKTVVASIGPITSNTAKELGIKVDIEADEYTIDGLLKAILLIDKEIIKND